VEEELYSLDELPFSDASDFSDINTLDGNESGVENYRRLLLDNSQDNLNLKGD
jgi:hypothetical protein